MEKPSLLPGSALLRPKVKAYQGAYFPMFLGDLVESS